MAGKFSSHVRGNVVGYIAVFIALSGSTYAAVALEKNQVKSKHIKNAGVKTKDLANNAVTSPKVADGSLLGEDFAAGQLPAGPPGERGAQGERGEKGEKGDPGATNLTIRRGPVNTVDPDTGGGNTTVDCNPGEVATGGGIDFVSGMVGDFVAQESQPTPTAGPSLEPDGWQVSALNQDFNEDDLGTVQLRAVVACASP